eukprot:TRINITY_DN5309_c0_g1_i1.p2 TRINITY_DN5309_c0_g1~~TRINITY_DN5309_c0_g1_i1.p2  ORF type:complete len:105 (-),score=16.06 TRINITY_DN5309_c0_g1_i1:75-389(-)
MMMPETSYFRFNPNNGIGSIPLDESDPKVLYRMMSLTSQYMASRFKKIELLEKLLSRGDDCWHSSTRPEAMSGDHLPLTVNQQSCLLYSAEWEHASSVSDCEFG